ncbi:MAG: hypothetical protein LBM95_04240 [Lactobacillales bacterium]|jgi:hypothetical protein|nr:hypothetical protein [Lactobacillales bacterium]
MISRELYKYIQFRGKRNPSYSGLYGKQSSVLKNNTRINKAREQAGKAVVPVSKIIKESNNFLRLIGVSPVGEPRVDLTKDKIDYKKIKNDNDLNNENHLVWMKFTTDGYLGVVAASNDINFDIPNGEDESDKVENHNTSGIIINMLGKEWDESFVLIFPLKNISDGLRKDIECGIGNYLISKDIPILDFYSHRFQ